MDVISELVGVPVADRAELRRLADVVVHRAEGVTDVPPEGAEAAFLLAAYYADMIAERRRRPTDDLTSALLAADLDGEGVTDDEAIAILFLMVVAGNETTTKLLGNAWYWGWRHPDELAKPLADPGRVPDWIEETLRYDNSTQMLVRVTRQDVDIAGGDGTGGDVTITEGEKVLLLIGSANRDDAVFADPDRYDLDRAGTDGKAHISFGGGRHFCMGASLARLEARVALTELVARTASYDIDPDGIRHVHSINVRGLAALPTTVQAAMSGRPDRPVAE